MVQACANNQCWLLPYLMVVNHMNMDGFTVGENAYDTDCELSLCLGTQILSWTNILYFIIS